MQTTSENKRRVSIYCCAAKPNPVELKLETHNLFFIGYGATAVCPTQQIC